MAQPPTYKMATASMDTEQSVAKSPDTPLDVRSSLHRLVNMVTLFEYTIPDLEAISASLGAEIKRVTPSEDWDTLVPMTMHIKKAMDDSSDILTHLARTVDDYVKISPAHMKSASRIEQALPLTVERYIRQIEGRRRAKRALANINRASDLLQKPLKHTKDSRYMIDVTCRMHEVRATWEQLEALFNDATGFHGM